MPFPDSDALFESGLGGGRPYLGSPVVVDGLLRHALHRVSVARRHQLASGKDAMPVVHEVTAEIQRVLYGQDPEYLPSAWNSPDHLGRALVDRAAIDGDVSDAVLRAATRMVREFLTDLVAHEQGRMDDADMQASVDAILAKYTRIFVGAGDA